MAGAPQFMVSRASLTIDGEEASPAARVSIRDNIAKATLPNGETHTLAVASLDKSGKVATVTGTDGTVWVVARRGCGCGGGR